MGVGGGLWWLVDVEAWVVDGMCVVLLITSFTLPLHREALTEYGLDIEVLWAGWAESCPEWAGQVSLDLAWLSWSGRGGQSRLQRAGQTCP